MIINQTSIEDNEIQLKVASIYLNKFYKFNKELFNIKFDIYIDKNHNFKQEDFIATGMISIFKKIGDILLSDLYISNHEGSFFSLNDFKNLLRQFPTQYELKKYANAKISSIISNHFINAKDEKYKFDKYLNKKEKYKGKNLLNEFSEFEKDKYILILQKLNEMLSNEISYSELQWQNEILQIMQIIYPKYIQLFKEVKIKDIEGKKRRLDFLLLDANGNIDIVEIKKPYRIELVSSNPYRDNYIPLRELTGSVMQVEKYIYYLNKWGKEGEKELSRQYKDFIPHGLTINITNPQGLIIIGRDNNLTKERLFDLEIIKRKYKNIIDIITYDDLLRRLDFIIKKFTFPKDNS